MIRDKISRTIEESVDLSDDKFELRDLFSEHAEYFLSDVCFHLRRDGSLLLKINDVNKETANQLDQSGEDYREYFASHTYYNLKEIFHSHKYHSPDADTIINVYRSKWKSLINFSLSRKIISLRKNGDLESLEKAMGILTYLEAFRENIMSERLRSKHVFLVDTFRRALEVDVAKARVNDGRSLVSLAQKFSRAVAIGLIAIVTYLNLNYDVNLSIFSNEIDVFPASGQNILVPFGVNYETLQIRLASLRKIFLVKYYLKYTDEFIIAAVVMFLLSYILGFKSEFVAAATRDIMRLALARPWLVRIMSGILAVFFIFISIWFVIMSV